jgi:hypothetical protein
LNDEASKALNSLNSSKLGMRVAIHQNQGIYNPSPKQKLFIKGVYN